MYKGNFTTGSTIIFYFNTHKLDGTPATLTGTPAIVSVYKTGSTEETVLGTGLTVDYDGRTGLNQFSINTSNAFYAGTTDYTCIITSGTVDSVSVVGSVVGAFSLTNRAEMLASNYEAPNNTAIGTILTNTNALSGMALESTLQAIMGAGWSNETLKAIKAAIDLKMNTFTYTAPHNDEIDAIKVATDQLVFVDEKVDANVNIADGELQDLIDGVVNGLQGGGNIDWTYTIYADELNTIPMADVKTYLTTDELGENVVSPAQYSNAFGITDWKLSAGTYYVWCSKIGYSFLNPDIQVVEAI